MTNTKPAVEVIDQARADYSAGRISRRAAIVTIRSVVDVTDFGAGDLLDQPQSAAERYRATGEMEPR